MEELGEYTTLLDGLHEYWQPVGQYERMLVEHIALASWDQCRTARFVAGAIRRIRDKVESQLREDLLIELEDDLEVTHREGDPWSTGGGSSYGRPANADTAEVTRTKIRRRLRKNPLGVRHLIQTIVRTIKEVERTGKLDAKSLQRFENEFLSGEECLAARVLELGKHKSGRSSPKVQAAMLELLREEQVGLEDLLVTIDNRQQEIVEAAVLEASIPSMADIEKFR